MKVLHHARRVLEWSDHSQTAISFVPHESLDIVTDGLGLVSATLVIKVLTVRNAKTLTL